MRVDRYLDIEDGVLIGYLLGIAWFYLLTRDDAPAGDSRPVRGEQTEVLTEDHLRRLENGGRVQVDRWHGNTVELQGTMVVDAERVDGDQGDSEEDR